MKKIWILSLLRCDIFCVPKNLIAGTDSDSNILVFNFLPSANFRICLQSSWYSSFYRHFVSHLLNDFLFMLFLLFMIIIWLVNSAIFAGSFRCSFLKTFVHFELYVNHSRSIWLTVNHHFLFCEFIFSLRGLYL